MSFSTVTFVFPYPICSHDVCHIVPMADESVGQLISRVFAALGVHSVSSSGFGIYITPANRWLMRNSLLISYSSVLTSLVPGSQIQIRPYSLNVLEITCLDHKIKLDCGSDQLAQSVLSKAISALKKQDPKFYSGFSWDLFYNGKKVEENSRISSILPIIGPLTIKKGFVKSSIKSPVFGTHLSNALARDGPNHIVPTFFEDILNLIEEKIHEEGIFRKNGNQSFISFLAEQIDKYEKQSEILPIIDRADVHDLSGLLKLYLKSLNEPLIPLTFFQPFDEALRIPDQTKRSLRIRCLLYALPYPNYGMLDKLIKCLQKVLEHTNENKMTMSAIATCISAVIIKNPDPLSNPIETQTVIQSFTCELIKNANIYFHNEPLHFPKGSAVCTQSFIPHSSWKGFLYVPIGSIVTIINKEPEDLMDSWIVQHENNEGAVMSSHFHEEDGTHIIENPDYIIIDLRSAINIKQFVEIIPFYSYESPEKMNQKHENLQNIKFKLNTEISAYKIEQSLERTAIIKALIGQYHAILSEL